MILDNIIPMSKELFKGFLGAACVLLCGQLHADWSDFLDEVGKKGNEWSEKGKEWGKEAVDSAVNQWDNLDFNYDLMQMFGGDVDEQSALVGRFYDLKQPVAEGAKPLTRTAVVQKIREFDEKEWDQSVFDAYYSPAVRLYAPYFYLPRCKASYGPEAFQCNGQEGSRKVAPSGWVVVYRGIVTAPEDGFFRFAGMGDDTLMVRFDNKLVLEAGWSIPTQGDMVLGTKRSYQEELTSNKNKRAFYSYKQTPHWNKVLGGIPTGEVFKVKKGKKYPIEILVSEIPGNEFGFCLLIEKVKSPGTAPRGFIGGGEAPVLSLVRTNEALPDFKKIEKALTAGGKDFRVKGFLEGPPFREDSPIWKVDYEEAEEQGIFDPIFGCFRNDNTAMGKRKHRKK